MRRGSGRRGLAPTGAADDAASGSCHGPPIGILVVGMMAF